MWLPQALIKDVTDAGIKVFYVSYPATRRWAVERDKGQPLIFSGWYWGLGPREGGPFKSQSSAYRDAWFRVVRKHAPPAIMARNEDFERGRNIEANKQRAKQRKQVAPRVPRPATREELQPR
jgi:hypothetical protein